METPEDWSGLFGDGEEPDGSGGGVSAGRGGPDVQALRQHSEWLDRVLMEDDVNGEYVESGEEDGFDKVASWVDEDGRRAMMLAAMGTSVEVDPAITEKHGTTYRAFVVWDQMPATVRRQLRLPETMVGIAALLDVDRERLYAWKRNVHYEARAVPSFGMGWLRGSFGRRMAAIVQAAVDGDVTALRTTFQMDGTLVTRSHVKKDVQMTGQVVHGHVRVLDQKGLDAMAARKLLDRPELRGLDEGQKRSLVRGLLAEFAGGREVEAEWEQVAAAREAEAREALEGTRRHLYEAVHGESHGDAEEADADRDADAAEWEDLPWDGDDSGYGEEGG